MNHLELGYPKEDAWKIARMRSKMWISPEGSTSSIYKAWLTLEQSMIQYWEQYAPEEKKSTEKNEDME